MTSQSEAKVVSLFSKCVDRKSWEGKTVYNPETCVWVSQEKRPLWVFKMAVLVCLFVLGIYMPLLLSK